MDIINYYRLGVPPKTEDCSVLQWRGAKSVKIQPDFSGAPPNSPDSSYVYKCKPQMNEQNGVDGLIQGVNFLHTHREPLVRLDFYHSF